jgi:streptomycin 6-kinase
VLIVPKSLAAACGATAERRKWLAQLPAIVRELEIRWSLTLGPPYDHGDVRCSWVAPAERQDGSRAVIKLGMADMESAHEIQSLAFWDGDPTVHLLEADVEQNAMLLERCEPGRALRELPEREQDIVIAGLLRRLWRRPEPPHPFRPLASMLAVWSQETIDSESRWPDPGLVREGLRLLEELARLSPDDVLLATDLHAGNVLRARREPWLAIDPKPFVGDRAYDVTQHLLNCESRVISSPDTTVRRMADLLEVDAGRIRLWMFARAAAGPRDTWSEDSSRLAKALA